MLNIVIRRVAGGILSGIWGAFWEKSARIFCGSFSRLVGARIMAQRLDRAVFLDRDGTLNRDTGYVHSKEAWEWLPGVREALARLYAHGWTLIIVSNQSGIARGYYTEQDLHRLEAWLDDEMDRHHVKPDGWYYCPHLPAITGPCSCRKPAPGMLLRAAHEHALSLSDSWMIGDKIGDVIAGLRAGCRAVKLGSGDLEDEKARALGAYLAPDLNAAADLVVRLSPKQ